MIAMSLRGAQRRGNPHLKQEIATPVERRSAVQSATAEGGS